MTTRGAASGLATAAALLAAGAAEFVDFAGPEVLAAPVSSPPDSSSSFVTLGTVLAAVGLLTGCSAGAGAVDAGAGAVGAMSAGFEAGAVAAGAGVADAGLAAD